MLNSERARAETLQKPLEMTHLSLLVPFMPEGTSGYAPQTKICNNSLGGQYSAY